MLTFIFSSSISFHRSIVVDLTKLRDHAHIMVETIMTYSCSDQLL